MVRSVGKCPITHISIDTETTGLEFKAGAQAFAVSLCTDGGDAYFFGDKWDINPTTRKVTPFAPDVEKIKKLLKSFDKIVMHNSPFDVASLQTIGIDLTKDWHRIEDTQFAAHALDSQEDLHLKPLAKRYAGIPDDDEKELMDRVNKARTAARSINKDLEIKGIEPLYTLSDQTKADMWLPKLIFPKDKSLERYATIDAERTLILWLKVFAPQLVADGLWDQYRKNMRSAPIVYNIHEVGLSVREGTIHKEYKRIEKIRDDALNAALGTLPASLRRELNINSRQQLATILYDHFDLPILYMTSGGSSGKSMPCTDADTLKELLKVATVKGSKPHTFLTNLLYSTTAGTTLKYLTNYKEHIIHIDGTAKLYPTINPTGTATTRVSGSNPNPQNVGKGKEYDTDDENVKRVEFRLRTNFGPRRGRRWYALDYDQLQLRIFANATGEKKMIQAFVDGYDFHTWMGCEIFGVAKDKLTKIQRRVAKNVNFGYIFGAGPKKIEATSGMRGLSKKLAKMFPIVTEYMADTIEYVRKNGYVYTMGGYRLSVPKEKAYSGVCYIVQGTEGEIVKDAMYRVSGIDNGLLLPYGDDFYMTLQVHDELVFDASLNTLTTHKGILKSIKQAMEDAGTAVGVATVANCEVNKVNWADSEKIAL